MSKETDRNKKSAENIELLKAMEKKEPVASFLNMKLLELTPGYSKVSMKLRPEYLNFNDYVFGGIIMSLADQAFAYAINSVNHPSVASQFNIHFIAGPGTGGELTAECRVVRNGRRVGISEITVTDSEGKLIARATGTTIPVGAPDG